MNRDGFSLLVMGFTGSKALEWKVRYIQAFNAMEAKLAMEHQDSYMIADPIARALKWAEEEKKRRALQATCSQQEQLIGELKPKADYTDKILQSKSLVPITAIAKDYGMSGQALNKILHGLKIIYRIGNQWLLYSKYQACGYTSSETVQIETSEGPKVVLNTKWTQKGRLFLYEMLKKQNIIPMIER
ncbi:MAG: phage regulatory protein/antirepressor Ant [Veillonellaceae bacterium]|nr:phage regulatory protein/antirepressor Ant [Veillonellaceae bacterium]